MGDHDASARPHSFIGTRPAALQRAAPDHGAARGPYHLAMPSGLRTRLALGAGILAAIAIALVIVLAIGADEGTAVVPDPLTVSPAPGSRWASPKTEISMRGLPLARLGTIEVSGSQTGAHAGRLEPHFDGNGASFVPDKPFEPGEEVHVSTDHTIPGATNGDYRFWVSRPAPPTPPPRGGPRPGGPVTKFRSRPDIVIPQIKILKRSPETTPGDVFIAPKRGSGMNGPMILDNNGQVVWARPARKGTASFDFRPQRYRGKPVLTWWQGRNSLGVGAGEGVVLDQRYRELMRVRAGNGYHADLHEFLITPRGTALVLIYAFDHADLTAVGGPKDGEIIDGIVQELDLVNHRVLFEWHSRDHIALTESHWPVPKDATKEPWDYVHLNAVAIDDGGDLLVSSRHTWTIYKVDRQTGTVRWRLGGRRSDFKLGPGAEFAYQHDVRRRADGAITMFDNAASQAPQPGKESRALALRLDENDHTASVAEQWTHPHHLLSKTQGDTQTLPNGHVFVGWGSQPAFSEFSNGGKLLFDGRIADGNDNYRAYRGTWTGRPATKPALVVDGGKAYVSWNGATDVARWQLLAGPSRFDVSPSGAPVAKHGFETAIAVPPGAKFVVAQALGPRSRTLAESPPVAAGSG
jgi:hypothetical protein